MTYKKAQSALENFTVYIWAILFIFIVVVALSYMGIFNLSDFLPDTCYIKSGLVCLDAAGTYDSLTISVRNNLGYNIQVTSVTAGQCTDIINPGNIPDQSTMVYSLTCNNPGSRYNNDVNITYNFLLNGIANGISHTNKGIARLRI